MDSDDSSSISMLEFSDDSDSIILGPNRISIPGDIKIRKGCKRIKKRRFENHDQARHAIFPDSVQHIDDYAFNLCSRLKTIYLPEGLLSIGARCFQDCTDLTLLHIPDSVREIGEAAFKRCWSLCSVILPSQLERIPDYCFSGCKLQLIVIPPRVKKIGAYAFDMCGFLEQVTIHSRDIQIERNCFMHCGNLKRVEMYEYAHHYYHGTRWDEPIFSIPNWGRDAFKFCSSLVEIDLSNWPICSFEESCFCRCRDLKKIILPKETTELMSECFEDCYNLKEIHYNNYEEDKKNPKDQFGVDLKKINCFGDGVFKHCRNLESVKLYYDQFIEGEPFHGCYNLNKISLPGHISLNEDEDIGGHKNYEIFDSEYIDELIVCSDLEEISYSMVYHVMYKIILRNPRLCAESCTPNGLYPIELAFGKLAVTHKEDWPDELCIVEVLYLYLRNAPWLLTKTNFSH